MRIHILRFHGAGLVRQGEAVLSVLINVQFTRHTVFVKPLRILQTLQRGQQRIFEGMPQEGFPSAVDANDDSFLSPASMIDAIKAYCRKTDQPVPATVGEIMQCVYRSLAKCYRDAIESLSRLTGKTYTSINIVGGGCRDMYLNQMTANIAGLPVYAGPVEGTAIGNLMVQMIAAGEFPDLPSARRAVKESFPPVEIQPKKEDSPC